MDGGILRFVKINTWGKANGIPINTSLEKMNQGAAK
jgi:hypothetical protein